MELLISPIHLLITCLQVPKLFLGGSRFDSRGDTHQCKSKYKHVVFSIDYINQDKCQYFWVYQSAGEAIFECLHVLKNEKFVVWCFDFMIQRLIRPLFFFFILTAFKSLLQNCLCKTVYDIFFFSSLILLLQYSSVWTASIDHVLMFPCMHWKIWFENHIFWTFHIKSRFENYIFLTFYIKSCFFYTLFIMHILSMPLCILPFMHAH